MKKRYRLHKSSEFERVRKEGRSWAHPLVVLHAFPNGLPYSRFGFTVSRFLGKAVVRNRIKRLMREAARHQQNNIQAGWDLVFVARRAIQQADYHQVNSAMAELLQQAKILERETNQEIAAGECAKSCCL